MYTLSHLIAVAAVTAAVVSAYSLAILLAWRADRTERTRRNEDCPGCLRYHQGRADVVVALHDWESGRSGACELYRRVPELAEPVGVVEEAEQVAEAAWRAA